MASSTTNLVEYHKDANACLFESKPVIFIQRHVPDKATKFTRNPSHPHNQ